MLRRRASWPAAAVATLAIVLTGCSTTHGPEPEATSSPEILATPDPSQPTHDGDGDAFLAAPGSVAVLAIDDFGGGTTPRPPDSKINCAYPTGTFGSKGGGGGLPEGMFHGEAVFNELYGTFTKNLNSPGTPYKFPNDLSGNGVKGPVEVWTHRIKQAKADQNIM